jgi:cytochrome P450
MLEREDNSSDKMDGEDKQLKKTLTNGEIVSQAILFLMAGYETTATALEFVTYNLAKHRQVQDLVCKEIDSVLEKYVIDFEGKK